MVGVPGMKGTGIATLVLGWKELVCPGFCRMKNRMRFSGLSEICV